MAEGEWELWTATYDGTTVRVYRNAHQEKTALGNAQVGLGRPDSIGRYSLTAWGWHGSIDEAQLHSVARSANWILTYFNMTSDNDTFWTVGAEEAAGGFPVFGTRLLGRIGPSMSGVR